MRTTVVAVLAVGVSTMGQTGMGDMGDPPTGQDDDTLATDQPAKD